MTITIGVYFLGNRYKMFLHLLHFIPVDIHFCMRAVIISYSYSIILEICPNGRAEISWWEVVGIVQIICIAYFIQHGTLVSVIER